MMMSWISDGALNLSLDSVSDREISDGQWTHFCRFGYFEGPVGN